MMTLSLRLRITEEIRDLHVFFERWFRGELPATRTEFARVERALGPDFCMITPGGVLVERAPLIESLWQAHSSTRDRFEIEVQNVREPRLLAEASRTAGSSDQVTSVFVLYEEWQWRGTERTARLSSAWLDEADDASWIWHSVHETWMPGLSASR